MSLQAVQERFLARYGYYFDLSKSDRPQTTPVYRSDALLQALEIMLAEKYNVCLSKALHDALAQKSADELISFWGWFEQCWKNAGKAVHDEENMIPLVGDFPNNIPDDMDVLWIKRILTLFEPLRSECVVCGKKDTIVALEPCGHRVCMHCFPNHTGCPICGRPIDAHSTFLKNLSIVHELDRNAWGKVICLDLGDDMQQFAEDKFRKLCAVAQSLSPEDRLMLKTILEGYGKTVESWLPEQFASKQMQAIVLQMLMNCIKDSAQLLSRYLKNATDVLRLIAVMSGEDGTLMPHCVSRIIKVDQDRIKFIESLALRQYLSKSVLKFLRGHSSCTRHISRVFSYQFKVARLSRAQRRTLLSVLESFDENALCEDFMRHRELWVRVGELLHPGDYEKRFPKTLKAFQIVRKGEFHNAEYQTMPNTKPPVFRTWRSQLETAINKRDAETLEKLMIQRPGEFARHLDRIMRGFGQSDSLSGYASERFEAIKKEVRNEFNIRKNILNCIKKATLGITKAVTDAAADLNTKLGYASLFSDCVARLSTPMLVQLYGHFGARGQKLSKRIFYPAGNSRKIYWRDDARPVISPIYTKSLCADIVKELLERFARKPHFEQAIVDETLQTLTFPFAERTNQSEGIHLSPGSSLEMPPENDNGKLRLFLHWCQKPNASRVDLDLSVAFFDENWTLDDKWSERFCCTYYKLQCSSSKEKDAFFARHSGDFREAPHPRGATEYVDIDRELALSEGIRYAVMLVQVYDGVDFDELERAYTGVMYRNDLSDTAVFDPLTVRFKYQLSGEAQSYIPVVFDLVENRIHDIQCYSTSRKNFCNLEQHKETVRDICMNSLLYFGDHPRTTRLDVALMHAAARTDKVWIRNADQTATEYVRGEHEEILAFYKRLKKHTNRFYLMDNTEPVSLPRFDTPVLAFLLNGDLDLAEASEYYFIINDKLSERFSWIDTLGENE